MSGLLIMDPKDRFSAKQALLHTFFDGLRTAQEEEQLLQERETNMQRLESSKNPRNTGTMSRNGDQSRSRSGLRNNNKMNGNKINQKNKFPQGDQKFDPINQDIPNKSRSLGRKNNEK
jgi:hypothetical protein